MVLYPVGSVWNELTLLEQYRQPCGKQAISMMKFKCSCGCLFDRKLQTFQRHLKEKIYMDCGRCNLHILHKDEYTSYHAMLSRCYTLSDKSYDNYGGRGIEVCQRWRISFRNFLEDMGKRPPHKPTLERLNVNEHYTPENCVWADYSEQNANRRPYKWK